MGGSSKSENKTETKNVTDIFETSGAVNDSSVGDGSRQNINVSGRDNKITTTDHGAVSSALDAVREVVTGSERRHSETLKAVTGLAQSTSLAGKDLELKTVEKVSLGAAIALVISSGLYFAVKSKGAN